MSNSKYGIENIVGKTVASIDIVDSNYDDMVLFKFTDGSYATMQHYQSCCESVNLEEYSQEELKELVGQTILSAREDSKDDESDTYGSSGWTFYNIQGNRSFANLRWFGSSNGYYSIGVTVEVYDS